MADLYALPPGADFAAEVARGLLTRYPDPAALARVTVFVNTTRMQRRLRDCLSSGARLLPRLRLITDLALDPIGADLPPAVPPLRRRLDLSRLVARLLAAQPDLAPRAALFDLSDSLARLFEEMGTEGVPLSALETLDVTDLSGHWSRALTFLRIAGTFSADTPDREARQRAVILRLAAQWETDPPPGPVIVAGSTGSRGATALFLLAVARLPQGAVILPGYDFDLPPAVWDTLDDALTGEDHPQYRFRRLLSALDLSPGDVRRWTDAPGSPRNALVSLALRPAPVTDQWRSDGPALGDLIAPTAQMTLLEAPSPRMEAETIALRLRAAVDEGLTAALITPDRMLTRQVAAALDRWNITPDDSGGLPLALSPPGRLLRQTAELMGVTCTADRLLALLKHPLTHTGTDRGDHLRHTRDLELHVRKTGLPFPNGDHIRAWSAPGRESWCDWLALLLDSLAAVTDAPLESLTATHITLTERLAAGPAEGSGTLWDDANGRAARGLCDQLLTHADAGGALTPRDYDALFSTLIAQEQARAPEGHPQILILGTLEARVQTHDLVILAGLNEGTWPALPPPDPWLNRAMRQQAGLLLPERQIGLSAHDYQQAIAAPQVWLTRAIRSADAQTVPSRWLLRLTNLLDGLPDQGGPQALRDMRARGAQWLGQATALSATPDAPRAIRPSPRPPVDARPKRLSVTAIPRLIRDPYAIYAEHVLRLRALDPLTPEPDALLRGELIHLILQRFIAGPNTVAALMDATDTVLAEHCPWPTTRTLWRARIGRIAAWFVATETDRQTQGAPAVIEQLGKLAVPGFDFTLTARADRIDLTPDGRALIYDYKSGTPPTDKQQRAFEKQLLLEAALVERGAFASIGPRQVQDAAFIGLNGKIVAAPLADLPPGQVWTEFLTLLTRWADPTRGYTARSSVARSVEPQDYDHLARFGEWDHATPPTPEDVP